MLVFNERGAEQNREPTTTHIWYRARIEPETH